MKIYIKKIDKNTLEVGKETMKESILSDLFTILVIIVIFGIDALFALYIVHSWIIDLTACLFLILYLINFSKKKYKVCSKIEYNEIIEKLF